MSLQYDNDSSSSPAHYPYSTSSYRSLTADINYLNYTLLESAAAVDTSLTPFHLTSDSNNNNNNNFYVDRFSHLQSPQKRRYTT